MGLDGIWLLLIKILVASGAMGTVCWWVNLWLERWLGVDGTIEQLIGVLVPIGIGVGVLIGGCKLLRVGELDGLLRAVVRRR